ncbi:MAG: GNAT family acetyltransferase [Candidatus Coatesbacteria bacterium]|nr:MAG: GNAT family acetyltransferase [Candidatus Coatesbacteria bacterium]
MERTVNIRPYEESDEETVCRLWREVFSDDPPWNVPEEDIRRKKEVQPELFFIAEVEGEVVGTAVTGYDGHRGWVYCVAVAPAYRREGVGRALMDRVERDLAQIGCHKLNLQVRSGNDDAVEFYGKLGYNIEERVSMGKLLER